jgi:hypothetical protein
VGQIDAAVAEAELRAEDNDGWRTGYEGGRGLSLEQAVRAAHGLE